MILVSENKIEKNSALGYPYCAFNQDEHMLFLVFNFFRLYPKKVSSFLFI